MRRLPIGSLLWLLCGCASAGSASLPPVPSASEALSETCAAMDYGRPYVVDWSAVDRADLREAERGGIVVVRYDCKQLRVLTDCRLGGHYAHLGTSVEHSLVSLDTAGEVRANLPASGAKLSAGIAQDTSLVLALAHAGKAVATVSDDAGPSGRCEGATHYVRGIYRGAFVMQKAARGRIHHATELFANALEATAHGEHGSRTVAGDSRACERASVANAVPPEACDIPLRLELRLLNALGAVDERHKNTAADATDFVACPTGFVEIEGRCHARRSDRAYACSPYEFAECQVQCERGNAVSCARQAHLLHHGEGRVLRDLDAARNLYERACAAGVQHGCSGLGVFYRHGLGGLPIDHTRSFDLQRAACESGEARGCSSLGVFFDNGEVVAEDPAEAGRLYMRACQSGLPIACSNLGTLHRDGRGMPASDEQAALYFQRACLQGSATGCDHLRDLALAGRAPAQAVGALVAVYQAECDRGFAAACESLQSVRAPHEHPRTTAP